MKMTSKEYAEKWRGQRCPYCRSRNISALEDPDPELDRAFANVECLDCGRHWVDQYQLVGYEDEEEVKA